MRVTEAGELYYQHARQVLLDANRVQAELDDLKGMRRGKVRIHAVEGIISPMLIPSIVAFRRTYPGVTFKVQITGSELVEHAVRESDTDVGITFNTQPHPEITCVGRWPDSVVLVTAPDHALASTTRFALADLTKLPVALPDTSFGIRTLIDQQCRRGRVVLSPALEANSIEALRAFAVSGAGLSVMSLRAVSHSVSNGLLVTIPLEGVAFQNASIDVCVRTHRRLSSATSEFIHSLVSSSQLLPIGQHNEQQSALVGSVRGPA
jgi:DNA-binding transcriptional LysR family regulator